MASPQDTMWDELNAALADEDYRKAEGLLALLRQYRSAGWLPAGLDAEECDERLRAAAQRVPT